MATLTEAWYGGAEIEKVTDLTQAKDRVNPYKGILNWHFILPNGKVLKRRIFLELGNLVDLKMVRYKRDGGVAGVKFIGRSGSGQEKEKYFNWNEESMNIGNPATLGSPLLLLRKECT